MKRFVIIPVAAGLFILLVYHALVFYDNRFPYGRMWETPAVRPHEEALLIMRQGAIPFDGGEAVYRATPGEMLVSPFYDCDAVPMKVIQEGKLVYAKYCAQCHGENHDGNGTVGQSFHPLPTNLKDDKVQTTADGELFKEISYGIPNGRQPPLASTIEITDRWRVIAYVKSLRPDD
jgi:mono/diheme cytochrome c family protein